MDPEIKNISSNTEKKQAQVAKYTAKDSVFTSLFREPKYQMYCWISIIMMSVFRSEKS